MSRRAIDRRIFGRFPVQGNFTPDRIAHSRNDVVGKVDIASFAVRACDKIVAIPAGVSRSALPVMIGTVS